MGKFCKTWRYNLITSANTAEMLKRTTSLYREVVAYYLQVFQSHQEILDARNWLRQAEILTHGTAGNPNPRYDDFDARFPRLPSGFRRSAIAEAHGLALSWRSNYRKWQNRKEKHTQRNTRRMVCGKPELRFMERPPLYPSESKSWPVYYRTEFRLLDKHHLLLKVFTGNSYAYRKVALASPLQIPTDCKLESPTLIYKKHGFEIHVPVLQAPVRNLRKASVLAQEASLKICAVDQGVGNHAACTIQDIEGRVNASLFLSGARDNHLRKQLLEQVVRLQKKTMTIPEGESFARDLWRKIRNLDDDIAHQVSRRIVDFAKEHNARVIVFEHLSNFRPIKGTRSKRTNQKLSYWLRSRIFKFARYKALQEGIIVVRVNPKDTSRRCPYCGFLEIARYTPDRDNGTKLARCENCKTHGVNADWLATVNIGRKFWEKHKSPA
ncbi:MAG: IS200/IS605 family accessory protein TnpB-related protein [Clostridium sp.]|nr:IS200/IS605 family accessory protein TnpB-related protein [Clostridium sp.]